MWNSSLSAFSSTRTGQFLINAPSGVGIGTASPTAMLTVEGGIKAKSLSSDPCVNAEYPAGTIYYNSFI